MTVEAAVLSDWREQAACQGQAETFGSDIEAVQLEAARLCWTTCPVRAECLDHATRHGEEFDVWGGYTAKQRQRMGRR